MFSPNPPSLTPTEPWSSYATGRGCPGQLGPDRALIVHLLSNPGGWEASLSSYRSARQANRRCCGSYQPNAQVTGEVTQHSRKMSSDSAAPPEKKIIMQHWPGLGFGFWLSLLQCGLWSLLLSGFLWSPSSPRVASGYHKAHACCQATAQAETPIPSLPSFPPPTHSSPKHRRTHALSRGAAPSGGIGEGRFCGRPGKRLAHHIRGDLCSPPPHTHPEALAKYRPSEGSWVAALSST